MGRRASMEHTIGRTKLELVTGDITRQDCDAIVNAANSRLAGGGGVDGAIHRRGGPTIMEETQSNYPQGCATGSAVITGAGSLAARYVIHAVGPVWNGGQSGEPEKLSSAYHSSLELALEHACLSIAFPSLSTGAYRYPLDLAAPIALSCVLGFLEEHRTPALARFVLFDRKAYDSYATALKKLILDKDPD